MAYPELLRFLPPVRGSPARGARAVLVTATLLVLAAALPIPARGATPDPAPESAPVAPDPAPDPAPDQASSTPPSTAQPLPQQPKPQQPQSTSRAPARAAPAPRAATPPAAREPSSLPPTPAPAGNKPTSRVARKHAERRRPERRPEGPHPVRRRSSSVGKSTPLSDLREAASSSDTSPVVWAALALLILVLLNAFFLRLMSRLVRERRL